MNGIRTYACLALMLGGMGLAQGARAQYFEGPAREAALERVEELAQIQAAHQDTLLAIPGVFGMGISVRRQTGEWIFKVWYDEQGERPQLPDLIEGVPLVAEPDTRPLPSNGGAACAPCHANQIATPVQMGNSGRTVTPGNCGACTMGFKACDLATAETVWVTAAHCSTASTVCPGSAPGTAAIGSDASHVSAGDDLPTCGGTALFSGSVSGHAPPICGLNSTVDATKIVSNDLVTQWSIRDIGVPGTTPGTVLPFDPHQKSGRTTGFTLGLVDAVNATVNVGYNCCTITMVNQIRILGLPVFCLPGDSGAATLGLENDITGLIIAVNSTGSTCWANQIGNVLSALNLSLDPANCAEPECPAVIVADETPDPLGTLDVLYRVRDELLGQSERGKRYIREFYGAAPAWVGLYARHPMLLLETREMLDELLPPIEALLHEGQIELEVEKVERIMALLSKHAERAGPGALRAQFEAWGREMHDPEAQAAFGIVIEGGSPDRDGDGIADAVDRCPDFASADQSDSDGDGVGDVCTCGDQTGDGRVDVGDLIAINAAIFEPALATPLCDANGDGSCDVGDVIAANARIFGQPTYCARYPSP